MNIIGIDIGGTNFRIGTVDRENKVYDYRKIPVKQVFTGPDPLADLTAYLRAYRAGKTVQAISIGFPATLDARRETVLQAPNIPGIENLPVVQALTRQLQIPVFIERDVTMALMYDCQTLNIPDEGLVCGIYYGTGIGNAISIHGIPLIGKDGTAGELGHIPVDGNDAICGCGNRGCMETVAGGKYLAHLAQTVYLDTPIEALFEKHGREPLLLQFVDRMAMAAATEINLLNPHRILISGGVTAMRGFPKDLLLERILHYTRKPLPAADLQILFTEDAPEKAVVGAAIYGRKMLK